MEAMLGISVDSYPYPTSKNAVFLIIVFVSSSTKLQKRAEQILPGRKVDVGRGRGQWAGVRNGPNKVCTYEYMNKEKKNFFKNQLIFRTMFLVTGGLRLAVSLRQIVPETLPQKFPSKKKGVKRVAQVANLKP
jgi:hypothetical protein